MLPAKTSSYAQSGQAYRFFASGCSSDKPASETVADEVEL